MGVKSWGRGVRVRSWGEGGDGRKRVRSGGGGWSVGY